MSKYLDNLDKSVILADLAGWSQIHTPRSGILIKQYFGYPPVATIGDYESVPDYFCDLERLHEVEKNLATVQCVQYFKELRKKVLPLNLSEELKTVGTIFLPARKRAEVLFDLFARKTLDEVLVVV